jgi:hypothetical protein
MKSGGMMLPLLCSTSLPCVRARSKGNLFLFLEHDLQDDIRRDALLCVSCVDAIAHKNLGIKGLLLEAVPMGLNLIGVHAMPVRPFN